MADIMGYLNNEYAFVLLGVLLSVLFYFSVQKANEKQ